jgi:hypothetical protein
MRWIQHQTCTKHCELRRTIFGADYLVLNLIEIHLLLSEMKRVDVHTYGGRIKRRSGRKKILNEIRTKARRKRTGKVPGNVFYVKDKAN